ncbi:hypothetical protein ACWFRB_17860 [Rhodococcus sp. NPDC055112]
MPYLDLTWLTEYLALTELASWLDDLRALFVDDLVPIGPMPDPIPPLLGPGLEPPGIR